MALFTAPILGTLIDKGFDLVDDLFTSDKEKAEAKLQLETLRQRLQEGQLEINLQEAKHKSVFVAGWRPAMGWTCALGFFYSFFLEPFAELILYSMGIEVDTPDLDTGALMSLAFAMLGLGGMRSYEKYKGVQSESVK